MSCWLVPKPWMLGGAAYAVAAVKAPTVAIPAAPITDFIAEEVIFTLNTSQSNRYQILFHDDLPHCAGITAPQLA